LTLIGEKVPIFNGNFNADWTRFEGTWNNETLPDHVEYFARIK
jgi:hypothetical protein